ncbi:prolipoprotein diacylglyceryl transferase [Pseudodesulfovibrio piezophilus]|uniref:Phosphatidylglycerol--prolipoprotein diacylglyceryl transferase n=1 Tax=Pseudodesulfovibrio piezophilus (strain DSM 21447 / JCM 15486 / C1TLV30) TaxID=1322246 RepID=M1WJY8_PSEP2|nr:prolipoprotein diacylglyceryl transferase [Pseudodesulfovibrio piezophilus]CCH48711.1 Prolipoprotein diacylglyceryl transferase [Pseudodesulfovibrio piezophilus C1TLV30]
MLSYPYFDPIMISVGPLHLRWYGMMYVFGVVTGWLLGRYRARKPWNKMTPVKMDDFITWAVVGVVLGGRLGYCLLYNLPYYSQHPLKILYVWEGGMSFHGGLLGVLVACWFFGRANDMLFREIGDFVAPLVPPGLFFGRLGNFINAELWGRPTDGWWGMVFPGAGGFPRHPSQLYEAGLEGVLLFIVLWCYSAKPRPRGCVGAMFVLCYGIFRFIVEFAREPDAQLGFVALDWMSMGQVLCLPMIVFGAGYLVWASRKESAHPTLESSSR